MARNTTAQQDKCIFALSEINNVIEDLDRQLTDAHEELDTAKKRIEELENEVSELIARLE